MKTQLRGNCPYCGNEQAVLKNGKMSKHGYTVKFGWFNGVCRGENHKPMQIQREVTDGLVRDVREEVRLLTSYADDLKTNKVTLKNVSIRNPLSKTKADRYIVVAFSAATQYQQEYATRHAIYEAESRARTGEQFADYLEKTVNAVHGTKLLEVNIDDTKPAPILSGERRLDAGGRVLVVSYVRGARVYWNKDGKGSIGWTGIGAWRKLAMA